MPIMPSILLSLLLLLLLTITSSTVAVVVDSNNKLLDSSTSSSTSAAAAAAAAATAAATSESKLQQQQQQHQLRRRRAVETGEVEEPDQKEHYNNANATIIDDNIKRNRIVGGQNVNFDPDTNTNRYPWFARVIGIKPDGGLDACGGSLIGPDLVLTAAHCTEPTKVYLGVYDLDNKPYDGIDVIANVRHPLYGNGTYSIDYDIMISQLATPVPSTMAQPIRLNFDPNYPNEETDTGLELTMLGFGSIIGGKETGQGNPNPPNEQSSILQSANTNYVPLSTCAISKDLDTGIVYGVDYPKRTSVKENWFCTLDDVTATCYGDSGGPIVKENYFNFNNDNNQDSNQDTDDLLLAVISGSSGYCGNKYLPLWNSRISFHKEWILYWGCQLSGGIGSNLAPKEWNCTNDDNDRNNNIGSIIISKSNVPIDNNVYYNNLDTNGNGDITDAPIIETITTIPSSQPVTVTATPVTDASTAAIATTNEPTLSPTKAVIMTNNPTTIAPTAALTLSPTPVVTVTATVAPTTTTPTTTPTTTAGPTNSPPTTKEPTLRPKLPPTLKPNPFPIPAPGGSTASPPQDDDDDDDEGSSDDDNDDDVLFVCPICGDDELMISNDDAVVFVPVVGQKTCLELETRALQGKIDKGGECESIQIMVPFVCDCISLKKDKPIPVPIQPIIPVPTLKPTGNPHAPTIPTCDALAKYNNDDDDDDNDINMIDNVIIDFYFNNSSAQYIGWYITDLPKEECFRIGTPSGNYYGRTKQVSLPSTLIENVEYKFVLQVAAVNVNNNNDDDENENQQPPIIVSGSYNISVGDSLLVSSGNVIFNDGDTTIFTTPSQQL